jgi:hypothetical protein
VILGVILTTALAGATTPAGAQELADFDYENLSFRGVGLEVGHLWGSRVEEANTIGIRVDLGYLGPGVRIVPSFTYWSSELDGGEVAELEESLEHLFEEQTGETGLDVDLGSVAWSDRVLALDAQGVWSVPGGLLTFAGIGGAVHFLNGGGQAITGTFVEDLLDSAKAGFNVHLGLEIPWERFRLYGGGRFEVLEDLHYFELRVGGQFMTGPSLPDERR